MGSSKSRHNRENQVKTLMLLLLISSPAWGQDTTKPVFRFTNSSPLRMIATYDDKDSALQVYLPNGDTVTHDMKRGAIPPRYISLADWDEWVDSCWADSTLRPTRHHIAPNCIDHAIYGYCDKMHHREQAWTHRDPNNLKEFMNFIRRKPEKGRR